MLSRRIALIAERSAGAMSLRMTLPPSGSGRPVFALPPFAEIEDLREAVARVGELAFVDDEARVGAPAVHGVEDFIERHDDDVASPRSPIE